MSAYMISSVADRRTKRSSSRPAYREKSGGAEADADALDLRDHRAGGLHLVGVDHRDRHHGHPSLDGHPGHPGLCPVEAPVRRTVPSGRGQGCRRRAAPETGVESGVLARPPLRSTGSRPDPGEEHRVRRPFRPVPGEVVGLGQEGHLPRRRQAAGRSNRRRRGGCFRITPRRPGCFSFHPRAEEHFEDRSGTTVLSNQYNTGRFVLPRTDPCSLVDRAHVTVGHNGWCDLPRRRCP